MGGGNINNMGEAFMVIDIGSCFNYGIEKFKQNMTFYVVGFLLIVGISIGINLIAQIVSFCWGFAVGLVGAKIHLGEMAVKIIAGGGGYIIATLLGILIAPFMVGYWKGIRKEYEGGTAEVADVFSAFDITIPCLINYAVANLVIIAGVICCVIPGILLSPLMNLSIFFLAKDEIQGLNALKRSWETLKKNPMLILWTIVLGLFAALGLIVCCVGILATAPISMIASYKLFQQAIGEDNLPPVEPVIQADDDNAPLPN